jgi:hypothetical protein
MPRAVVTASATKTVFPFMVTSSRSFAEAIVPRLDQEIGGVTAIRYFFDGDRWPIGGEPETRHDPNVTPFDRTATNATRRSSSMTFADRQ